MFFYDSNGQLIGEYRDNASTTTPTDDWLVRQETIWLEDIPVAVVKKPIATGPIQVHYIHADHLNTPRVIVNQSNTIIWRWENTHAFGANQPNEDPDGNGTLFEYQPRFPGQYFDKETGLHYNYFRYYEPETGRYISPDPIGLAGGMNVWGYVGQNPLSFMDPYGLLELPVLSQGFVDFSAGLGDALLLGTGGYLRNLTGIDGGVNPCSDAYDYGAIAALAVGGGRVAYAGLAKAGSVFASSGVQASAFRAELKSFFRGGIGRNWRPPNLVGKTDAQLRASAGKTNFGANTYGVGIGVAGGIGAAQCGCQK